MKAQIFSHGDPSVGVWGNRGGIDTGIEVEDDEREGYRADIAKFFSDLWSEPATVLFEDEEFGEFGGIERKKSPLPATEQGSGHWLMTPKNGGKPYTSSKAPDSWEVRECDIQWVPEQPGGQEDGREHDPSRACAAV